MNPTQKPTRWAQRLSGALALVPSFSSLVPGVFAVVPAVCALVLAFSAPPLAAGDIPDRPEKLQYPELRFEPPEASKYRVKLAGGIPAYLVPDHTLPLVNVVVLMRIGPDLDP